MDMKPLNVRMVIDDESVVDGLADLEREYGAVMGDRRWGKRTIAQLIVESAIRSSVARHLLGLDKKNKKP